MSGVSKTVEERNIHISMIPFTSTSSLDKNMVSVGIIFFDILLPIFLDKQSSSFLRCVLILGTACYTLAVSVICSPFIDHSAARSEVSGVKWDIEPVIN